MFFENLFRLIMFLVFSLIKNIGCLIYCYVSNVKMSKGKLISEKVMGAYVLSSITLHLPKS